MSARSHRPRALATRTLIQLGLIGWTLTTLLPLVWMLSASLQTNQEIYKGIKLIPDTLQFQNYIQAWEQAKFSVYFQNSVIYTVAVVAGAVLIASLAAYSFAKLKFPGKNLFYVFFLIFILIPIPGQFIPLYLLLTRLKLIDSRLGYILPLIQSSLPTAILILRSFFEEIPSELDDAARVDGASRLQIFWRIALPLSMPAIATIIILTAIGVWNEFTLALVVFSDADLMPLQVGIMNFQGTFFSQYALMMAATSIATLPILILYIFLQKYIIRGVMAGAVKG